MVTVSQMNLLDTNMVSYLVAQDSERLQRRYTEAEKTSRIAISAVTEGEIRYGLAKKPDAVKLAYYMQRFLDRIEILPWDSYGHAELWCASCQGRGARDSAGAA